MKKNIDYLNTLCLCCIFAAFLTTVVIVSSFQNHIKQGTEEITDSVMPELLMISELKGKLRESKLLFMIDYNQGPLVDSNAIEKSYLTIMDKIDHLYSEKAFSDLHNNISSSVRMIKESFVESGPHTLRNVSRIDWAHSLLTCSAELTKNLMHFEEFLYLPQNAGFREEFLPLAYEIGGLLTDVELLCNAMTLEQCNENDIGKLLGDIQQSLIRNKQKSQVGLYENLESLKARVSKYYKKYAFHPEADYSSLEKNDILSLMDKVSLLLQNQFQTIELKLDNRGNQIVNDIREKFTLLSGVIITCMLFTLVIWRVINYTLDQRIKQFVLASDKLSDGENDVFIDDFIQDRFGAIIHAFNKMSAKLNASKEELKSSIFQLKKSGALLDDKNRELTGMLVERDKNNSILEDQIRQREEAEEELQMAYTAIESSYESILLLDKDGYVIYANNSYYDLAQTSEQAILGSIPKFFSSLSIGSNEEQLESDLPHEQHWQGEISIIVDEEVEMPVLASISEVSCLKKGSSGYVVALANISDLKEAEKQLSTMAFNDPLTSLPNRPSFMAHLNSACASVEEDQKFALLYIDLDGFKNVNDTLGHQIGDELLKEAATRLCDALWRERDMAFRLGGDEFTILLHDIQSSGVNRVAQRIIEALRMPFSLAGHEIHVSASIGIAICPDDGEKVHDLVKYADLAMYNAKREGKNRHCKFHESMASQIEEKLQVECKLRKAIQDKLLTVVYQPIVDPYTSNWIGAEALVRWNDHERGFISPAVFIPIAEEVGLIEDVGNFVLSQICTDLRTLQADQIDVGHIPITFNLSASELLNRAHMQNIHSILSEYEMSGEDVSFEITESVLLKDLAKAKIVIEQFSSEGFKFLLDDFGTGYSSFYYLKTLPFSKVKLDKSFIDELDQSKSATKVVDAMVTMCKALNMELVAEGVEREQQVAVLKSSNIDYIQGYFYSRPLPFNVFHSRLVEQIEILQQPTLC